ncbi:MAG: bifunctional phosphoserine phosphatase/homoserine phosphotransferase ThrH [Spirochaetes bacterium]|nr:bifunctional phosphoserine phosphatase/homoserine phosphotransferase ThrH [Spirochaetota bacterium]
MYIKPTIVAMDFEGVLIPEIWIAVAERTRIEKLRLTTRDISDYDALMKGRLEILKSNGLLLKDIQDTIARIDPLEGALEFLAWVRKETQAVILTDSFYEFVQPFLPKFGYPTIFCNSLKIDGTGAITGYRLRQKDGKKKAVSGFSQMGFRVIAMGDSYNDTTMLKEADLGILFRPSKKVVKDFPEFDVFFEYDGLKEHIGKCLRSAK